MIALQASAVGLRPDAQRTASRRVRFAQLFVFALLACGMSTLHAQIAFRSAASGSAQQPSLRASAQAANARAPIISFVGAGAQVAGVGASITPVIPAFQPGDFALLVVAGRPPDNTEPSAPVGWTLRSSLRNTGPTPDLRIVTFHRILQTGDANPPVTLPVSWRDTANGMSAQIAVWRGVDSTTPFDVADATGTSGAAQNWTPSPITTVTDGAWVVSAVSTSDDNALTVQTAQGFTGRMTGGAYDTTTGGDFSVGLADVLKSTAGATTMLTWRQTANNNDQWAGITFALRPAQALTIAVPTGTAQNDVMIASIAFRPRQPGATTDVDITAPAGWTLVRRMNNTGASANALAVFRRVAGAGEPASYRWTFACYATCVTAEFESAVGGIKTFSGVDTTNPVDVENGQATAIGAHTAPSINTTVANTLLVASHAYASSGTWSAPAGMAETVDVQSSQLTIEMSYASQAAAAATGAKQATPNPDDDIGNAHLLALRPAAQGLTVNVPPGTTLDDVMIASVAVRPSTATITPPAGWTLVRRVDNANASSNSLVVYQRVAGGSEPASYTWALSGAADVAGGILSFSGVDRAAPIDVENGQCTPSPCSDASQLVHATPSVMTTVTDTMIVTSHTFASSRTWAPPAGMTEGFDVASQTAGSNGQAIESNYALQTSAGATGAKSATAAGDADVGNTHILALKPPPPPPPPVGGFNGFETATAAGATTGIIKTKIAGSPITVDIVALNADKTAVLTTFTGAVKVEVIDASNNSGALDSNGCRPSWSVIQTLSNPTFATADSGRKTITFTQANSYPDVRLRITYPTASPTNTGCSTDNFAIRPSTFGNFTVTDTNWETAGSPGRALSDLTITAPASGGVVHKAGRPFSVRATALNAAGTPATATNYTGAPTATLSACAGVACTSSFGALTLDTTFSGGQLASDLASYSEVGAFYLQLVDTAFASVDAADSSTAERYVTSGVIAVGRFVPDHFAVSFNTPLFATACTGFSYAGQAFNYSTAPVITVTAQDFSNNTTALYAGTWFRVSNSTVTNKIYSAASGTVDTGGLPSPDPIVAATGGGVGTLTFGSGTGLFFTRTLAAPFNAEVSLSIDVIDADGIQFASNPARFGAPSAGNGIAFSDANPATTNDKSIRFGRLRLSNANGSQLIAMPLRLETQYWNGSGFVTNTDDSCTVLAPGNIALGNYQRNLSSGETAVTISMPISSGVGQLRLSPPGAANDGSVDVSVNLTAGAAGASCTAGMPATAGSGLGHLQGAWCGAPANRDPTARATFGVYRNSDRIIYQRENF
jgi:MSHA biogenesis protein MshQ